MSTKNTFYVLQNAGTFDFLSNIKHMEWGGYFSALDDFDVLCNVQQFSTIELAAKARNKAIKFLEKMFPEDTPITVNIVKVTETSKIIARISHTVETL
jgi:hypothetical protein